MKPDLIGLNLTGVRKGGSLEVFPSYFCIEGKLLNGFFGPANPWGPEYEG